MCTPLACHPGDIGSPSWRCHCLVATAAFNPLCCTQTAWIMGLTGTWNTNQSKHSFPLTSDFTLESLTQCFSRHYRSVNMHISDSRFSAFRPCHSPELQIYIQPPSWPLLLDSIYSILPVKSLDFHLHSFPSQKWGHHFVVLLSSQS